ncbi:MAG: hypothetical protein E7091_01775 [Bacteroidales bacterium]|nr:hypothetical protein [Bacteroidales bacterium]
MKKLFYWISMACLLVSCGKDEEVVAPEPEPLVVTNEALAGTWVYDDTATGVVEVLLFTKDGSFKYTATLADAAFAGYPVGNYTVADDVNVTAAVGEQSLDMTITKMVANSFTAKNNATGETRTYAKLVETISLAYLEGATPDYASLVDGEISSYKSHNVKVATVDKAGLITAVAEGITLIDVATSDGTAVVLVRTEGLIPNYAKAIGYTKEKVLAEYGETIAATNEMILYTQADKFITFNISKRTKKVEKVAILYSNKPFSNNDLVKYLNTKYYAYMPETTATFFAYTDKESYETSGVKITFDSTTNLVFSYINHDLFENFSIALGKTMEEVVYMYGEELTPDNNLSSPTNIAYTIGNEILGYAGVELMNDVNFSFDKGVVSMVELGLADAAKYDDVFEFLSKEYVYSSEVSSDIQKVFYDERNTIKVVYITNKNEVRYTFAE